MPVSMIICNDIMAYMFGFFFGRTKLIDLSPKKTWEGFLGGGVSTVLIGLMVRQRAHNQNVGGAYIENIDLQQRCGTKFCGNFFPFSILLLYF